MGCRHSIISQKHQQNEPSNQSNFKLYRKPIDFIYLWDVCAGSGSICAAYQHYTNYKIFNIDIKFTQKYDNGIYFLCDITKLDTQTIKSLIIRYPPIHIHNSPICNEYTNIKNSVGSRNLDHGDAVYNACIHIKNTALALSSNITYTVENPDTKYIRPKIQKDCKFNCSTSYCMHTETIYINGQSIKTFPYQKHTIIGHNIPHLQYVLPKCDGKSNQCGCMINGKHIVGIKFKGDGLFQVTDEQYLKQCQQLGLFQNMNPKKFRARLPILAIHKIHCHKIGM